ncbi:hypothetical protein EDC01DRAFT_777023 [Geopyxis carbonaria]|nr:hypothetical protein EDC01DRAFT_777023 [Geopyxis carbonaria]
MTTATDPDSAYTPIETLLLFHELLNNGVHRTSFSAVSAILLKNPLVITNASYNKSRLSPDALHEHYLYHLNKDQPQSADGVANESTGNGRRRKGKSPPGPATANDSPDISARIRALTENLYQSYQEGMVKEIRAEENRYSAVLEEISAIHHGSWDDRILKEEAGRTKPPVQTAPPGRKNKRTVSPVIEKPTVESPKATQLVPSPVPSPATPTPVADTTPTPAVVPKPTTPPAEVPPTKDKTPPVVTPTTSSEVVPEIASVDDSAPPVAKPKVSKTSKTPKPSKAQKAPQEQTVPQLNSNTPKPPTPPAGPAGLLRPDEQILQVEKESLQVDPKNKEPEPVEQPAEEARKPRVAKKQRSEPLTITWATNANATTPCPTASPPPAASSYGYEWTSSIGLCRRPTLPAGNCGRSTLAAALFSDACASSADAPADAPAYVTSDVPTALRTCSWPSSHPTITATTTAATCIGTYV